MKRVKVVDDIDINNVGSVKWTCDCGRGDKAYKRDAMARIRRHLVNWHGGGLIEYEGRVLKVDGKEMPW